MLPSDLPTDLNAFLDRFGSEEQCRAYLFALRWPDGFRCQCGAERCYRLKVRLAYECASCGTRQALLAGSIFEQTKSPLRFWFRAIYFFVASKGGLSALELKRHMGFKSDQTAWAWAAQGAPRHGRIRHAARRFGRGRRDSPRRAGAWQAWQGRCRKNPCGGRS